MTGKVTLPPLFVKKRQPPILRLSRLSQPWDKTNKIATLQSGIGALASHTLYSRTRSEATKPPFSKRGLGGNVNISYYTQMRPFSGLRLPRRGKAKGG